MVRADKHQEENASADTPKEVQPLKVGDKVKTADGMGKVVAVTETTVDVDLDNKTKGIYKLDVVSAI